MRLEDFIKFTANGDYRVTAVDNDNPEIFGYGFYVVGAYRSRG